MTTIVESLQQISDAEEKLGDVARSLLGLYEIGALQTIDVQRYNTQRIALYGVQLQAYANVTGLARAYSNTIAGQIPVPQLAPALPVGANYFPSSTLPAPSVSGLGNPIVIAVGGVSVAIPVWAVIVIAIVVAVAAVAAVAATVQMVTASEQIDANLAAMATYYQTVERTIRQCRVSGGSVEQCSALASGIQTPRAAMPEGPQTTPPGGDWTQAAKWLALGTVGIFGAILVAWTAIRSSNSGSERRGYAPRYLPEG